MALFYPTLYRRRITDLTPADLRTLGVSGLLLDVDNTLTTHDCPELEPAVTAWLAAKPLPGGYRAAARALGLSPQRCAVIGDQIFTDILGANLAGMPSVLLEPIQPETQQKFIVFKRRLERLLLRCPRQRKRKEAQLHG